VTDSTDQEVEYLLEGCPGGKRDRARKWAKRSLDGPGKRTAAIRLACLQCTNWQSTEVNRCEIRRCGLWKYRMG
jgi:hypothetical protein